AARVHRPRDRPAPAARRDRARVGAAAGARAAEHVRAGRPRRAAHVPANGLSGLRPPRGARAAARCFPRAVARRRPGRAAGARPVRWLIDASNVIGSRPDGWWRDRDGAARRLIAAVRALGEPAIVVLDTGPDDMLGSREGVTVVRAARRGRDAADDEIVRILQESDDPGDVRVVTSDAT